MLCLTSQPNLILSPFPSALTVLASPKGPPRRSRRESSGEKRTNMAGESIESKKPPCMRLSLFPFFLSSSKQTVKTHKGTSASIKKAGLPLLASHLRVYHIRNTGFASIEQYRNTALESSTRTHESKSQMDEPAFRGRESKPRSAGLIAEATMTKANSNILPSASHVFPRLKS